MVDPAATATTTADGVIVDALQSSTTIMKAWIHRREKILYEYAVSGTITLSSKAMVEIKGSGLEDGSVTRHLDKYDQRLAHLEKRQINEEGENVISLTHIEYSAHVDKLVAELEQVRYRRRYHCICMRKKSFNLTSCNRRGCNPS
jgi:hypothetical protein